MVRCRCQAIPTQPLSVGCERARHRASPRFECDAGEWEARLALRERTGTGRDTRPERTRLPRNGGATLSSMTRIRAPFAAALVVLAAVALSGCATSSGGGSIDPVGTWAESSDADAPSLTLAEGGKLTGTDGCNQLSGSWELEDDDLVSFGSVASTRMACPDVDVWLDQLSQASISGSTMTILGQDGAEIGQLERTD